MQDHVHLHVSLEARLAAIEKKLNKDVDMIWLYPQKKK
jgi:hypothetical protein